MREASKEEGPKDLFEELKQVKAERDLYYEKLLRVRAKVQVAGNTNERVDNFKTMMQARTQSIQEQIGHAKNPSGEQSIMSKSPLLMSYGNASSPSDQVLRQYIEPEETSNPAPTSKRVSITVTPVQLDDHSLVECAGRTIETKAAKTEFEQKERLAKTQTYGNDRNRTYTGLRATTIADSSSVPSHSCTNQQQPTQTI